MRATTTEFYSAAAAEMFSPPVAVQPSAWHSPVPYLFGGLAAMLGLIAFALLLLACSFWNTVEGGGADDKDGGGSDAEAPPAFVEKVLVIMAGELKPTFLATPTSGRAFAPVDEINRVSENSERKINPENGEDFQEYSTQLHQHRIHT